MQVEGKGGFTKLVNKVRAGGPTVLFHGALAASGESLLPVFNRPLHGYELLWNKMTGAPGFRTHDSLLLMGCTD